MSRSFASVLVCIAFVPGCASQSGWTPTVDTYGNSRAQYLSQDLAECKALAGALVVGDGIILGDKNSGNAETGITKLLARFQIFFRRRITLSTYGK